MHRSILFAASALCALAVGSALAVQCLNGLPPSNPDDAYVDHGDGTVTDVRTGLMWKKCSEGQTWDGASCSGSTTEHLWADALALAQAASFAGYEDWRLPSRSELESLVEHCTYYPAINVDVFPDTPIPFSNFWSASPFAFYSDHAWFVSFNDGVSLTDNRSSVLRVRLVRGGQ